ncbi:flagellar hook-associated protein FlgL [Bacillaceae bacterium Marseille-Q3522]|nr:flagellar hook-associated protein FlgL [Bacillaceae bacterium Marseille-Q3522]
MRVTQSMLASNMLRNLSNSYERLGKLQTQLATEKKFSKPSDDPVAAMMGLSYRTDVARIAQYTRNIGEVRNWVDSTDDALDNAVSALQRISELAVEASNDPLDAEQKSYIAKEISELKTHLSNIADTKVGGKFIFNGTQTNRRPSSEGFSTGEIQVEVFEGIKIPLNIEGRPLFEELIGNTGGAINDLITSLENDDTDIATQIDKINAVIDQFVEARATIGAKQNRVDLIEARLGQQDVLSKRIMSDNEDIDIEKTITELTTQESIHQAALSVGSRIIQPSLVDFLR